MQTIPDSPIPILGLGTYQLNGPAATAAVRQGLAIGYRHIDTAQMYENEIEVGRGVRDAGLSRDQVFITTKVWPNNFGRHQLPASVDQSLQKLGTDYIDLLLLHWPSRTVPLAETLDALVAVQGAGKARFIGVSNFTVELMRQATELVGAGMLVNNQVEYHPFLNQDAVIETARSLGMTVTAYRPIAKGQVFQSKPLRDIAERCSKTPAQVALRWLLQQGIIAIPRTGNEAHLQQNFELFDFELSAEDMQTIRDLEGQKRLVSPAGLAPAWD